MPRVLQDFSARPPAEQQWLLKNSWCPVCELPDLGMLDPVEYADDEVVILAGRCKVCGAQMESEIHVENVAG